MKTKYLSILSVLLLSFFSAGAQEFQQQKLTPEERAQHRAEINAQKILLSDEVAAKFIPVYKEYCLATQSIQKKYRPAKPQLKEGEKPAIKTDKEIDQDIRNQFKKSQELLDLRIAYYEKYLKILSPRQIRELYKIEKHSAERAIQKRKN